MNVVDSKGDKWINELSTDVEVIKNDNSMEHYRLPFYDMPEPVWLIGGTPITTVPWHLYISVGGIIILIIATYLLRKRSRT